MTGTSPAFNPLSIIGLSLLLRKPVQTRACANITTVVISGKIFQHVVIKRELKGKNT
jgi:hypothetical protein